MCDLVFKILFLENTFTTIFGNNYNLSICQSNQQQTCSLNPPDQATIL
jgi:hypothetical protein